MHQRRVLAFISAFELCSPLHLQRCVLHWSSGCTVIGVKTKPQGDSSADGLSSLEKSLSVCKGRPSSPLYWGPQRLSARRLLLQRLALDQFRELKRSNQGNALETYQGVPLWLSTEDFWNSPLHRSKSCAAYERKQRGTARSRINAVSSGSGKESWILVSPAPGCRLSIVLFHPLALVP